VHENYQNLHLSCNGYSKDKMILVQVVTFLGECLYTD